MWLRFFPAVEHARVAMERGDIGDVKVVQADYPDRVYALSPAITGFGAEEMPLIAAADRKGGAQPYAERRGDSCVQIIDEINRQCAKRGFGARLRTVEKHASHPIGPTPAGQPDQSQNSSWTVSPWNSARMERSAGRIGRDALSAFHRCHAAVSRSTTSGRPAA